MRRPGESCSEVYPTARRTGDKRSKTTFATIPADSVVSHGNGRAFEGQSRDDKIGVALGLSAEHQYRLFRRSQAECQDTVDIDRCEICGGDAKILHQEPCACLDVDRGIEEEQRLVRVTLYQHVRDLPPHAITRIDTEDNSIRIARKRGDGLLPMGVIHIESLSAPGRSPCSALAVLRIADGNQIATVEVLKHQLVERCRHAAEIEHG